MGSTTGFSSSSSSGWEVQAPGGSRSGLWGGPSSWFAAIFLSCPSMLDTEATAPVSLLRIQIPFPRLHRDDLTASETPHFQTPWQWVGGGEGPASPLGGGSPGQPRDVTWPQSRREAGLETGLEFIPGEKMLGIRHPWRRWISLISSSRSSPMLVWRRKCPRPRREWGQASGVLAFSTGHWKMEFTNKICMYICKPCRSISQFKSQQKETLAPTTLSSLPMNTFSRNHYSNA